MVIGRKLLERNKMRRLALAPSELIASRCPAVREREVPALAQPEARRSPRAARPRRRAGLPGAPARARGSPRASPTTPGSSSPMPRSVFNELAEQGQARRLARGLRPRRTSRSRATPRSSKLIGTVIERHLARAQAQAGPLSVADEPPPQLEHIFITRSTSPRRASASRSRTSSTPPGIRTTYGSAIFADHVPGPERRGGACGWRRPATPTSARRTCTSSPSA